MSRNGSGVYSLPAGNPVTTGTTISSTWANNTLSDIATALTASIAKDGQTTPTANIPMGNFKVTGLGAGTAATDAANVTQVQNSSTQLIGSVAGTNTITGSLTPAITAYAAGQTFQFVSAGANTGAATININGLGAKAITKSGSTALASGDIPSGAAVTIIYDGTQFQLSSGAGSSGGGSGGTDNIVGYENDTDISAAYTIGSAAMVSGATITIASPAVVTIANSFVSGQQVRLTTTGALPTGLDTTTAYYVIATGLTSTTCQLSLTRGGAAINTSGSQSGTHSIGKTKNVNVAGPQAILDSGSVTIPSGCAWVITG